MHDDVLVGRVEVAHELQRGHHGELVAPAVLVEHAEVVEAEVGADADQVLLEPALELVLSPVAGQDAGDVRAVVVPGPRVLPVVGGLG